MSAWQQRAIDCAPGLKKEFEVVDSPYMIFSELLPALRQAHIDKNKDRLQAIYGYAEWCFRQKDQKLWNAASVSFYEHLGDNEETFSGFTDWIKKDIYFDIRGLLNERFDEQKMKMLDRHYGWK